MGNCYAPKLKTIGKPGERPKLPPHGIASFQNNQIVRANRELEPSMAQLSECFASIHLAQGRQKRMSRLPYEMSSYWVIDELGHRKEEYTRSYLYKKMETQRGSDDADQLSRIQYLLRNYTLGAEAEIGSYSLKKRLDLSRISWYTERELLYLVVMELAKVPNPLVLWEFRLLFGSLMQLIGKNLDYKSNQFSLSKLCVFRKDELAKLQRSVGKTIEIMEFMDFNLRNQTKQPTYQLQKEENWVELKIVFPSINGEQQSLSHRGYSYQSESFIVFNILSTFVVRSLTKQTEKLVAVLDYGLVVDKSGILGKTLPNHQQSLLLGRINSNPQQRAVPFAANLSAIRRQESLIQQTRSEGPLIYLLAREEEFKDAGDISQIVSMIGGTTVSGIASRVSLNFKRVEQLMAQFEYQQAESKLRELKKVFESQKAYEKQARAWYLLVVCLQKMERFKAALAELMGVRKLLQEKGDEISKRVVLLCQHAYASCICKILDEPSKKKDLMRTTNLQEAVGILMRLEDELDRSRIEPLTFCECVLMKAQCYLMVDQFKQRCQQLSCLVEDAAFMHASSFSPKKEAAACVVLAQLRKKIGPAEQVEPAIKRALEKIASAYQPTENSRIECLSTLYCLQGDICWDDKRFSQASERYQKAIDAKPQTYRQKGEIVETCTAYLHLRVGMCLMRLARMKVVQLQAAGSRETKPQILSMIESASMHFTQARDQVGEQRLSDLAEVQLNSARTLEIRLLSQE